MSAHVFGRQLSLQIYSTIVMLGIQHPVLILQVGWEPGAARARGEGSQKATALHAEAAKALRGAHAKQVGRSPCPVQLETSMPLAQLQALMMRSSQPVKWHTGQQTGSRNSRAKVELSPVFQPRPRTQDSLHYLFGLNYDLALILLLFKSIILLSRLYSLLGEEYCRYNNIVFPLIGIICDPVNNSTHACHMSYRPDLSGCPWQSRDGSPDSRY